jgi:hypothetical protein
VGVGVVVVVGVGLGVAVGATTGEGHERRPRRPRSLAAAHHRGVREGVALARRQPVDDPRRRVRLRGVRVGALDGPQRSVGTVDVHPVQAAHAAGRGVGRPVERDARRARPRDGGRDGRRRRQHAGRGPGAERLRAALDHGEADLAVAADVAGHVRRAGAPQDAGGDPGGATRGATRTPAGDDEAERPARAAAGGLEQTGAGDRARDAPHTEGHGGPDGAPRGRPGRDATGEHVRRGVPLPVGLPGGVGGRARGAGRGG